MDEKDLVYKLSQGDESAFKEIFMLYYQQLVVFASKMVYDLDLSRDLVQEVIVNFYEKRNSIEIHTSLKAHLYQSVRNRCINYIKREQNIRIHHSNMFEEKKDNQLEFTDLMEETELEKRIYDIINTLPNQCQKIFEMSRFDGKKNSEIAEELNISKRTVETQISNALKKIRAKLSNHVSVYALFFLFLFTNFTFWG